MPRVSVIIPAYNAVESLEAAVLSVLKQTEPDFELLIVDDASTDNTQALAKRLAEEDARIRIVSMARNSGKSAVMNRCMHEAAGRWIAILDADDWYAPSRLQRLLDAGESLDIEMVSDDWIAVDKQAGLHLQSPLPRRKGDIVVDLDQFLENSDPTAKGDYGMLKGIIRADFARRTGIRYYEAARRGEDFYFLLSFFVAGGRCLLVNEAFYYYVEPFGSVSRAWAQEGRKRYSFEVLIGVNRHFIELYADVLTPRQRLLLQKRGEGWCALAAFHQLREAWQDRKYAQAIVKIITAPSGFWRLIARRSAQRLKRVAYGAPRRVIGRI
jgi:glycosyltransferase involved in cell wall biosynthesis